MLRAIIRACVKFILLAVTAFLLVMLAYDPRNIPGLFYRQFLPPGSFEVHTALQTYTPSSPIDNPLFPFLCVPLVMLVLALAWRLIMKLSARYKSGRPSA